jgi:hypothetical protein
MNKNIINVFKKGYKCRTNLARGDNGDLADSHNILTRLENYSC